MCLFSSNAPRPTKIFPPPTLPRSSPDHLLNPRIHSDHLAVNFRVFPGQHLGIPRHGNKYGLDATGKGGGEDVGNLKADEKCKGENDRRKVSVGVVWWVGEEEVEVGKEGAGVSDEQGTKGENGANKAILPAPVRYTSLEGFRGKKRNLWLTLTRASMPRSLIIVQVSFAAAK